MKSFLSLCSLVLLMGASSLAQQKRFIFRLDDIQDWFDNDIQANLLNFWMDNNIPVTAVVISNFFWGTDPETLAVVTKCAQMSPDMCQLGNHSPNHDDFFEYVNDTANAIYELQEVNNKIHTFFPGYEVEVFVPPFNYWNHNSLYAMQELKMPVISASSVAYSGMAYNLSSYPLQMPQQTQTGIYWANNNSWTPYPAEYIVLDCEEAAAKGEVCVIMVHTFEFAMQNGYTIAMLQDLVNQLYAAGFTGTNYHTVLNEVRQNTVPLGDTTMGRCGVNFGGLKCPYYDRCCSSDGWCGTGGYYCNAGCQVGYGYCNVSAEIHPTASPTAAPITKITVPTVSPTTTPKSTAPSVGSKGTTTAPSVAKTTAPNIGSITVPTAKTIAPTIRSTASPTLGQTNFVEGSSATSSSSSFEFNTQNIAIIAGGGFAFLLILAVGGYYYYQRRVMKKKNWTERVKSFRTENSEELIEEGHQTLPKSDSALMGFVEDNLVLRHGMKLESERKPVSSGLSADNNDTREVSAV